MFMRIGGMTALMALAPLAVVAQPGGSADDAAIRPFEIAVSDETLEDLKQRLNMTRLPDQLDGAGWDYGTELEYLTELITYWRDEFDWRAEERRLNEFDQFKTVIDGLLHRMLRQMTRNRTADQRDDLRESLGEAMQVAKNPAALQEEFDALEVGWTPPEMTGFEPAASGA